MLSRARALPVTTEPTPAHDDPTDVLAASTPDALFGGTVASELLYALSLGATCLAYGVDLDLAQLIAVNTAASVLSSVMPTPGGIGAAEASLSAGLIAMGVDEPTAFAIAITQRLWTFYLPPIWGFASLRWLSRRGYV